MTTNQTRILWTDQPTPMVDGMTGYETPNGFWRQAPEQNYVLAKDARAIEQRMREGERLLSDPRQWSEDAHEWQQWSHEVDVYLAAAREMDGGK